MAREKTTKSIISEYFKNSGEKRPTDISAPITFFAIILSIIFAMSVLFRVNNIEVQGNIHYTDREIISAIDIEEGDNIFFFDRFAAIARVFAKLPYVEQVTISRSLPGNVKITVLECEALAYIIVGDEKWTLDQNCKILGKATEEELPNLIPIKGINPGTLMIGEQLTVDDDNEETVTFVREVLFNIDERGMTHEIKEIDFTNLFDARLKYTKLYQVWLGNSEDITYKFGMLSHILSTLTSDDVGIINLKNTDAAHFIPQ